MDHIIVNAQDAALFFQQPKDRAFRETLEGAARRLEECRALLRRLANDEQAPEGHTFQSWARELLV